MKVELAGSLVVITAGGLLCTRPISGWCPCSESTSFIQKSTSPTKIFVGALPLLTFGLIMFSSFLYWVGLILSTFCASPTRLHFNTSDCHCGIPPSDSIYCNKLYKYKILVMQRL